MRRAQRRPESMTTLSTHDTKRSEDVRARINVISELPEGDERRTVELFYVEDALSAREIAEQ